MFELSLNNATFGRIGLLLLLAQMGIFLFGLPPFHVGIWVQEEPVLLALFAFASLDAAWLAIGIAKRWLVASAYGPLWWCMVAWVVWQIVATILATTPWRSWFGPPEVGEGTCWHISLLLMVMVSYPLLHHKFYRHFILAACLAIIAFHSSLHLLSSMNMAAEMYGTDTQRWVPTRFAKDLPFMVAYIWIALNCWPESHKHLQRPFWRIAFCCFSAFVLWVSENRTAIIFMGFAIMIELLRLAIPPGKHAQKFFCPGKYSRILAIIFCLLPLAWVAFAINFETFKSYVSTSDTFMKNAHVDPTFSLFNKEGSIGSRIPYLQVAAKTMTYEPLRWLKGDGWGRYTDDLYKYALVDGVYAYHDAIHAPNWSALEGFTAAHSHCQPVEALLSLGFPGMILWFAIPMVALWYVPKLLFWSVVPMLVASVMISYFWFEIAQDVAFRALALASLCYASASNSRDKKTFNSDWNVLILAAVCFVMAWSAWQQRQAIVYIQQLRYALYAMPANNYKQEWLDEDSKRGGDRLRELANLYEFLLIGNAGSISENDRDWYDLFLRSIHQDAVTPGGSPRVASTELYLMYKLFSDLSVPAMMPLKSHVFPHIPEAVLLMAHKAPLRDDVAASFLANINKFMPDDSTQQIKFLRELLVISPNHRGALWVLGGILRHSPGQEQEGKLMMQRAVALGLTRVFPVTDADIAPYQ